jgi:hypothetical protein
MTPLATVASPTTSPTFESTERNDQRRSAGLISGPVAPSNPIAAARRLTNGQRTAALWAIQNLPARARVRQMTPDQLWSLVAAGLTQIGLEQVNAVDEQLSGLVRQITSGNPRAAADAGRAYRRLWGGRHRADVAALITWRIAYPDQPNLFAVAKEDQP